MRTVLLLGPSGSGRIPTARQLARALPAPSSDELVDIAWMHCGARLSDGSVAPTTRPFRAPHHTVSEQGLVGSIQSAPMLRTKVLGVKRMGPVVRPGELSLAHHGTLLLDELMEFRRSVVETVGRVLREGRVEYVSGGGWQRVYLPARPELVLATASPCACATLGSWTPQSCRCTDEERAGWTERLVTFAELLGVTEILVLEGRMFDTYVTKGA